MEIGKILVPLDGSKLAEHVLYCVKQFAIGTNAEVLLVNVQARDLGNQPALARERHPGEPLPIQYLDRVRKQLEESDLHVRCALVEGNPAESILRIADDQQIDLVAMTTHGRSGVRRWVLGSVADEVVHRVGVPLLLVRPSSDLIHYAPAAPISKILVPLDGSTLSLAALPMAESIADAIHASLVLVHVVSTSWVLTSGVDAPSLYQTALKEMRAAGDELLRQTASEIAARGLRAECIVATGSPMDEIERIARSVGAGLVALSTHGRSGIGRSVMGSIADAVVRRTTIPCLVVRPDQVKRATRELPIEIKATA